VPASAPPALVVAWSLVHEMIFYTLFAMRYVSRGMFWSLCVAWAWLVAGAYFFGVDATGAWNYVLSPRNLEFLMGVLTCLAFRSPRIKNVTSPALTLGIALTLSAAVALSVPLEGKRLLIAAGYALSIFVLCRVELVGLLQVPRWTVFLGAASYAIYLVHVPTLAVVAGLVAWIGYVDWIVGLFILFCAATVAGITYHILVEAPLLRLFRRSSGAVA